MYNVILIYLVILSLGDWISCCEVFKKKCQWKKDEIVLETTLLTFNLRCSLFAFHQHNLSFCVPSATAWSGIDGRIKADLSPVSFSMLGLNTTDPISNSVDLQWASRPKVDDEWSGFNGMAAADPSSDWNAPVEHWGNYEEPPVLVTPAPVQKEQPVPNKVLEDERDTEDPSGGEAKSKKKRKKKKKTEEETASDAQTVSTVHVVNTIPKPQELPALPSKKQNASISSSQKRSEQIAEPPKSSQKKKVRRET